MFFTSAEKLGFKIPEQPEIVNTSHCKIIAGKAVAADILIQCKNLAQKHKVKPHLCIFLIGEHAASKVYVKNKLRSFDKIDFKTTLCELPESISEQELIQKINAANSNADIHGIIVQLPLPKYINREHILRSIDPKKDVDGFLPQNMGLCALGSADGFRACTPLGIMLLLATYKISLVGKHCVVIGRSAIVGKPMALLLLNSDATVTLTHSKTDNLEFFTKSADIVISATGSKYLLKPHMLKAGSVVVDVGIFQNPDGSLNGDVHPDVASVVEALTPVPGGVGPMTIAMLAVNTAIAAWGC